MDAGDVFTGALPRLQELKDDIIVIKVGGHAMIDPATRSSIIKDIVTLRYLGLKPVVVHGGGPEIDAMLQRMGKTSTFISGLRVTDDETMEIVRMVLVGNVNTDIVTLISKHGGKGVGLLGNSGNLLVGKKKDPEKVMVDGKEAEVDYGWVGETIKINTGIVLTLLNDGYIPVISPVGYDQQGKCLNLNADTAAGDIAAALKAKSLIALTDVNGVMMDPARKETLISKLTIEESYDLIKRGIISKGMIPKILSSITVLRAGIGSVHIINGNIPHALVLELLTEQGVGTSITK